MKKGFTLLELLIVIGIIAVLIAAAIFAFNPAQQFAKANNAQRVHDLNQIISAIQQNMIDNRGPFSCAAGNIPDCATGAKIMGSDTGAGQYDICPCLVSTYLPQMPVDPQYGSWGGDCSNYDTQYEICSASINLRAPRAQLGETITAILPGQITVVIPPGASDTTPPTVGTTSPTSATVNAATTFSASVSDNVEVSTCNLFVNGVNEGPMSLSVSPCTSCTASKDYTFALEGTFPMYASCSDPTNNNTNGQSVNVNVTSPDFSISGLPATVKAPQTGTSQTSTITITSFNNFNSAVSLSVISGLPVGATANFSPNPVTPPANGTITSDFTVTTSNVTAGSYNLTIQGQSGALTKTTSVTLEIVDLSVTLIANPSSGNAPLNNVDLTATVSGSATGTINYKFDCTNDGIWELEENNSSLNPYTAIDLCDYATAGNYTAKVYVERDVANPTEDTTTITVTLPPPPVFDAVSSANALTFGTFTWSHTIGGGSNRLLVVGFTLRADASISSVRYNNVNLTQIRTDTNCTGPCTSSNTKTSLWYMGEAQLPAAGIYTVQIIISLPSGIVGGATSWTGVNQTTPIGNNAGAGGTNSNPSVIVTSGANEIVIDTVYVRNSSSPPNPSLTVGSGQTQQWNLSDTGWGRGGGSSEPGAASVTMSWTYGARNGPNWSISAAAIRP